MAVYIFENTDANEAAGFNTVTEDTLAFSNVNATALNVTVTPGSGLNTGITITSNGQSLAFSAPALAEASQDGRVQFDNGSSLVVGTNDDDTGANAVVGTDGDDVIYGFGGIDSLFGGDGNDYLYGGTSSTVAGAAGADTLNGGAGNDHIYGNALTTTQGQVDGADIVDAGSGADYVNGNAGNDTISGGAGADRLFGGNGNDSISGGTETDQINGNRGDDIILGDAGNDILRGGQGLDTLQGGADNDILYGDLGNDSLVGGAGDDVLFGGDGADVFSFAAGDSDPATTASGAGSIVDIIADFQNGSDTIDLPNTITAVTLDNSGSTFGTVLAAQQFAQSLANASATANTAEVVALNVGGDAYLFATTSATAGANIDLVIKVTGVTASVFNVASGAVTSDFI